MTVVPLRVAETIPARGFLKRFSLLFPVLLFAALLFVAQKSVLAQKNAHAEPQIHNTITLPRAAHKKGQTAGFFIDPITGNRVYRLSDADLCPNGAQHFYSYTNQFSPQGRTVFDCFATRGAAPSYPVYSPDYHLEFDDALGAARVSLPATSFHDVQWSQEREVLYARAGGAVVELDPVARKSRVVVDFAKRLPGFALADGHTLTISGIDALSVGPKDRLMVHLTCLYTSPGCPKNGAVIGIGVFDPATDQTYAMYVPVPGDKAPDGFDEGQWSQNPNGRLVVVYGEAPSFAYSADLSSRVKVDDNHGHRGYFCGSNGRCYIVRVKNDDLPNGRVGQKGCVNPDGSPAKPWKPEYALYDDASGKRVLVFACDLAGQNAWQHLGRSLGGQDVFGISSERFVFGPSLERFFPTDEAILRARVDYAEQQPVRVAIEPVAYHRSATGPRAKLMGRECGYWASPRVVVDGTGKRFLFDSTMSHAEWPALEGRKTKTDCHRDVFVAEAAARP